MEGIFNIVWNGRNIGQVTVFRQGLYYHFTAICDFDENTICRLMIRVGGDTIIAGVMVPEANRFTLNKKIPVKRFGDEIPEFYIPDYQNEGAHPESKQEEDTQKEDMHNENTLEQGIFVPVSMNEPFGYLHRLKSALLTVREGKTGVWIPEKQKMQG